ncbi:MAG: hypothetical protein QNJ07_15175 [Woeseiaceae bacterium]|nr:hypothetical protein [Woeseiaceae bacterium]
MSSGRHIVPTLLVLLPAATVLADDAPELRHNPFSRPPSKVVAEVEAPGRPTSTNEVVLTATLVTDGKGMAHVSGLVLRPGDEIYGKKLLRVYEDRAVFLENGKEATVYVKPAQDEDDEEKPRRRRPR